MSLIRHWPAGLIARALFISAATFMFVAAAVILPSLLYLAVMFPGAESITRGSLSDVIAFVAVIIGCVVLLGITIGGVVEALMRPTNVLPGIEIELDEEPHLRSVIWQLCSTISTSKPDVVVLSAEPVFAVLQGRVRTVTGTGRGRILILGASCLPSLTVNELRAVLAHEFAHFTGFDAWYSAIIIPIRRGLRTMLRELKSTLSKPTRYMWFWVPKTALIAPYWMLGFYDKLVSRSESKLADAMEIRADHYAASICGSASFANGLMKVTKISAVYEDNVQHRRTHPELGPHDWNTLFRLLSSNDVALIDAKSCPASVLARVRRLPKVDEQYQDHACSAEALTGLDQYTHTLVDILELAQPSPRPVSSKTLDAGKYATFGARVAALFIDYIVFGVVAVGLLLAAKSILSAIDAPVYFSHAVDSLAPFLPLMTAWLYFATAESRRRGATIGKRAFKISVAHVNGGRISFLRATVRFMAKLVQLFSLGVGTLTIFFTDRRQAMHDMWCSTLVIKDIGDTVYPTAAETKRAAQCFQHAVALYEKNQLADAVRAAREAVRLKPDDGACHAILGFALYSAADYRNALQELLKGKNFVGAKPPFGHTSTITSELIGDAHMKLGEYGEAVEEFQHVLRRNPNSTFALFRLGVALQFLHQDEDSLQYLLRAVSVEPANATYRHELAVLQSRLGDNKERENN